VDLQQRLAAIRVLILDVDGVLTDRGLYFDREGVALKRFDAHDGLGIQRLQEAGIPVAIATGDDSEITARRAEQLGVSVVCLGVSDKRQTVRDICRRLRVRPEDAAYVGDDLTDLPAFEVAGLRVAVGDAIAEVQEAADILTERPGGCGAVREVCDAILTAVAATNLRA
jgi:3-deoxy-D-manno-octulosonate 8-phosphate phosphatase (KDO 8-P phosphatase)